MSHHGKGVVCAHPKNGAWRVDKGMCCRCDADINPKCEDFPIATSRGSEAAWMMWVHLGWVGGKAR